MTQIPYQCEIIRREGQLIERVAIDRRVSWEDVISRHAQLIRHLIEGGFRHAEKNRSA